MDKLNYNKLKLKIKFIRKKHLLNKILLKNQKN